MIEKLGITRGPWHYGDGGHIVHEYGGTIAQTNKDKQDGLVLAAAPEMLEALIELQKHNDLYPQGWNVKDIIAKATGRSWAEVKAKIE